MHEEISAARERIRPYVLKTPLFKSTYLSDMIKGSVYLKLESEQYTGSFKARGALNKILKLTPEERAKGLVTASTGNHAQGFARGLSIAGAHGTIFLPTNAASSKVEALKYYDAKLKFFGDSPLSAELHAIEVAEKDDLVWISPYNDLAVIEGQGTLAVEITEDLAQVDAVLGCIGGGGMMSGVATWFEHASPRTKIIGCLPENSPEMKLSIEAGKVVFMKETLDTLSDGSAGGLEEGAVTFDICRRLITDYQLVSEEEIAKAIKYIVDKHHKIIEGAAGVALASFFKRVDQLFGKNIVIIICGANITTAKLKSLL